MTSRLVSFSVSATLVMTLGVVAATGAPAAAADVATVSCEPNAEGAAVDDDLLASFEADAPRRLVDTRDGTGGVSEPVGAGCTLRIDVDEAGVPAQAAALAFSVTGLGSRPGFMSVFPCAGGQPATSNLNTRADGFPTPNLVVAIPDRDGMVCVFSLFEADVIVDLTGWWTVGGEQRFSSLSPVRVDDSREDDGGARVPAFTVRTIPLADFVPDDTTAIVANLTVAGSVADGFITAFPCGNPVPNASNLNFRAGEARAVAIAVGVGPGAELCVQSNVDHHVIVDIAGFYAPAPQFGPTAGFMPVTGRRLADSRTGEGGWDSKFGAGTIRRLTPTEGMADHAQSTAVLVNVVATQAEDPGFVTVYPCDDEVPNSSALNYSPAGESTNIVAVDLSPQGEICLFTLSPVHLVVDLFGVVRAPDGALAERMSLAGFTWPPFTPDGSDYVVECDTSTTDLTIELLRSTTARVNGVPVTSGTIDLPTDVDDLVWVQLRRKGQIRNYWFRCVPDGFPRLEIERTGEAANGWYVTTTRVPGAGVTYAVILDARGAPVWYKQFDRELVDIRRRTDGHLTLMPELGPRYGVEPDGAISVMSLTGTIVDDYVGFDTGGLEHPTDHHDNVELPGGGLALLSYPVLDGQDLTALGPGFLADDEITDGVIQELDRNGNLVWDWSTLDHFGYDEVPYPIRWPVFPTYDGTEVDVFHLNSLMQVDDGSEDYVVSARHLDAVFRVDHATEDLEWIVGSLPAGTPNKSGAPRLTVVGDPFGGPRRPHDARVVGDVLTLFDNRTDTGEPARAVAYEIDTTAGTATMLWQIQQPQGRTSLGLGSVRLGDEGSVLVAWGAAGQPTFGEFTTDGTPLLQITQVGGGVSYRITKEPVTAFSASLLRATAGGRVTLP